MNFGGEARHSIEVREDTLLAYFVKTISDESAMIPRGSILKNIDGGNRFNPNFQGLNQSEALSMKNYQLFRSPRNDWNRNLIQRPDLNYYTDFLDTPDDVLPGEHTHSVFYDKTDKTVYIHSLAWIGMHCFHECETRKFGFAYFGNGRKNFDLIFLL